MEITITVNAPGLSEAITKLALAIEGNATIKNGEVVIPAGSTATVQAVSRTEAPQQTAPTPEVPQQTVPTQEVPQQQTVSTAQATQSTPAPSQQTTPISQGKALTLDDLARAGAGLVDQGKMQQVIALLGKYGVQAITQLQPEHFEAFAGELRTLGAII